MMNEAEADEHGNNVPQEITGLEIGEIGVIALTIGIVAGIAQVLDYWEKRRKKKTIRKRSGPFTSVHRKTRKRIRRDIRGRISK